MQAGRRAATVQAGWLHVQEDRPTVHDVTYVLLYLVESRELDRRAGAAGTCVQSSSGTGQVWRMAGHGMILLR